MNKTSFQADLDAANALKKALALQILATAEALAEAADIMRANASLYADGKIDGFDLREEINAAASFSEYRIKNAVKAATDAIEISPIIDVDFE